MARKLLPVSVQHVEIVKVEMFIVQFIQSFRTVSLFILVLALLLWQLRRENRIGKFASLLPGPKQHPIIGSALELLVPRHEIANLQFKLAERYGSRYVMRIGPSHYYVAISNAADIEKVLSSSVHISKGDVYNFLMPWLGEGLLTSQGNKWQRRRKMLTPAFHFKILEDFLVVFNENANILVGILQDEFANEKGSKDIFPYVTRCALDIICETAMDKKIDAQRHRNSPYIVAVYRLCELLVYRAFRVWYNNNFLWSLTKKGREWNRCIKTMHEFTEKVIRERKADKKLEESKAQKVTEGNAEEDIYFGGKKRLAFLDLLLDAQKNPENELSDTDIREEVDTFMFEGHDTTAANLGWTLFLLASNPEHQVKVIEELESIFGDDRKRPATSEDLTKMKYLELCIKESLRLYPSVPFIARHLHKDLVLDEDTIVPAGVNMVLLGLQIHRNKAVFPDPEVFMPERFLPENTSQRHPFAYIPFSAGPRNCIGQKFALMEEKVVLSTIFRSFVVEAAEKIEDMVILTEVITRPRDGFNVKLQRLDTESKAKLMMTRSSINTRKIPKTENGSCGINC